MEGPPLGPGGEDITWPDQVAPRGRKATSTRKIKPQTSSLVALFVDPTHKFFFIDPRLHWSLDDNGFTSPTTTTRPTTGGDFTLNAC